jgi:DNA-binding beta-propeller fold protein YncE
MRELLFLDADSGEIQQTLSLPRQGDPRPGYSVIGLAVRGDRVYASDAQDQVRVAARGDNGKYVAKQIVPLAKPAIEKYAHPAGMAWHSDKELWVTSTRGNSVQLIDFETGVVKQTILAGVAPYTIVRAGKRYYVTNWGGDIPNAAQPLGTSSGQAIRIDPKTGVADHGSVSVLEELDGQWRHTHSFRVGLHPCAMAVSPKEQLLYVANANSDTITIVRTDDEKIVETIRCRPEARLPFGSGSNALALSPDGQTLYVANGTNNCIAVVNLGVNSHEGPINGPANSTIAGLIPTGWYPGAILVSRDGKKLFVANIKGHGSLSQPRATAKGKNSHDHLGSVSIIDVPDRDQLIKYTAEVNANNRLAYSLAGLEKPRPDAKPLPLPERHGEPSVFKHVLYIIKENRTYDQVFGDMKEGNGDPNLVVFGEEVTPNQHALARQFTLFDNFYCSGVLSADGHCWISQAYVTDYLERAFGGFTRSYPDDGSDPLAYAPTGFLWDSALDHKLTFRSYGEFVTEKNAYDKGTTWAELFTDYKTGNFKTKVNVASHIKKLNPYTHPHYPWFPLLMPDVYRAKLFLDEFREFERKGEMPNLIYLTLPCNHTTGTRQGYPTPRASVADNDLALGQIVEAVSKSKFWADTCICVVEDDPQNGFDHVDGHRTVALVISPYTKRKYVDHTCYNQTGMVKTIELMLGLPPLNQLDLSATPMRACFHDKPDLTPYVCLPNRIPLDEMNLPLDQLKGQALHWAKKSMELDLDEGDAADEDTLNRIIWHSVRGYETPYPEQFVGSKEDD